MTLKVERLVLEIQQKCMTGLIAAEKAAKETEQKEAGNNNVSRKKEIKVGKFREKKEERLSKKQSAASQPKKNTFEKRKPITLV